MDPQIKARTARRNWTEQAVGLLCLECDTPVQGVICPTCGRTVRHVTCSRCGAPLHIINISGYGNVVNDHIIVAWTDGGTPTRVICPCDFNGKIDEWRKEEAQANG